MTMNLGATSYIRRWQIGARGYTPETPMTTSEFITEAADFGFTGVQLCDHLNLDPDDGEKARWKTLLESGSLYVETGSATSRAESLVHLSRLTDDLGGNLVRVVPDIHRQQSREDVGPQIALVVEQFQEVLSDSSLPDILFAVENHGHLRAQAAILPRVHQDSASPASRT